MKRLGAWKAANGTKAFVQFLLPTSGYRNLYILSNVATTSGSTDRVIVTFNGDNPSGGSYRSNFLDTTYTDGSAFRVNVGGSGYFTDMEGFISAFLLSNPKQMLIKSSSNINGFLDVGVASWNNTAALTTIRFSLLSGSPFATGSTITLYAI